MIVVGGSEFNRWTTERSLIPSGGEPPTGKCPDTTRDASAYAELQNLDRIAVDNRPSDALRAVKEHMTLTPSRPSMASPSGAAITPASTADSAPVGVLAIDYGPWMTLPDMGRFSYCVVCCGPVEVRPAWRAMSRSLIGQGIGSEGQT